MVVVCAVRQFSFRPGSISLLCPKSRLNAAVEDSGRRPKSHSRRPFSVCQGPEDVTDGARTSAAERGTAAECQRAGSLPPGMGGGGAQILGRWERRRPVGWSHSLEGAVG